MYYTANCDNRSKQHYGVDPNFPIALFIEHCARDPLYGELQTQDTLLGK